MKNRFFNLYSHDFARVAVGVPRCRVADPAFNALETIDLAKQAAANGAVLVAFPELGLSAYTCDDLFHQRALLDASEEALGAVVAAWLLVVEFVGLRLSRLAGGQHPTRRDDSAHPSSTEFRCETI